MTTTYWGTEPYGIYSGSEGPSIFLITQNPSHVTASLDLLPAQFWNSTNLKDTITSFVLPTEQLESIFYQLATERGLNAVSTTIKAATGDMLDQIGLQIGLLRNSTDDEVFRLSLQIQVLIQSSHGLPSELIAITQQLVSADSYEYSNLGNATCLIHVTNPVNVTEWYRIADAVGGGILLIREESDDNALVLSEVDSNGNIINDDSSEGLAEWVYY